MCVFEKQRYEAESQKMAIHQIGSRCVKKTVRGSGLVDSL